MAKFKVIVSDPSAKSKVVELEGARAVPLIGKRIGETIDGTVVGMSGAKMQITGGSDKDGFPMRPNVHGGVRISVMLSKGIGFHPTHEGERQRKTVRGNIITEDIVQINMKTLEKEKKAEKPKKTKKPKVEAEAEPESTQPAQPSTATSGGETAEETAQTTGG
ncbi:MAG TPA: 30S ribosomal protein S6e [Candidatus Bathyarchaeia archaeon]|nr:30S ribosomal protein S6e [Candidatus Bathyarchaeia archaeon]